jgi:hypothetical protein
VPAPRSGKQEPGPDGFTVGLDDGEETDRPLPVRPRPPKQKVGQKPASANPSPRDQTDIEKLNLTICRGC